MKNIYKISLIALFGVSLLSNAFAEKSPVSSNKSNSQSRSDQATLAEACQPATGATDLDVNNVRCRINTGGDMWWDLQHNAKYFIPKDTKKCSMYSGSLWMAGVDVNGQLKCCAQRYRGNGNDFWPGPLSTDGTASVDASTCKKFDKHFYMTKAMVLAHIAWANSNPKDPSYKIPDEILNWPAHGDVSLGQDRSLAPFMDVDGDGVYNPANGDYPYYDIDNKTCNTFDTITHSNPADKVLFGDATLWWVFNDKGNIHSETKGSPIGFEIRAQAFGFTSNDEINNMTFYNFQIINRSTYTLTNTYFSLWTDTDLGYAYDDFVGCDVMRGLGYCYNGLAIDGSGKDDQYGANPPAVGVDFFQGPYIDPNGKADRFDPDSLAIKGVGFYGDPRTSVNWCGINGVGFNDKIVDNERFGMRRFIYHNNGVSTSPTTDPDKAQDYYNLLRGIWKDNQRMVYNGKNGHPNMGTGTPCDFMFPGLTDIYDWGTGGQAPAGVNKNWTEETAGNTPYDRRFMHSTGPFTLKPGATNYITVGIPWARTTSGGPLASVELLKIADDKCQRLFDNCFKMVDGPDAPDLTIQEMDKSLVLMLTNPPKSNNFNDSYPFVDPDGKIVKKAQEFDFNIVTPDSVKIDTTVTYKHGKTTGGNDTIIGASFTINSHPDKIHAKKIRYDSVYRFEGYLIYQLLDNSVSLGELGNTDKARLVAQTDVKNGVSRIINYEFDLGLGASIPVEKVNGANTGIKHSFMINQDMFATGNNTLINHKKYYYVAIAYAYNNYKTYNPSDANSLDGQKLPFLSGRQNGHKVAIPVITAIPHIVSPEAGGTYANTYYGFGPKITRVEGFGNGGLVLDFTPETEAAILAKTSGPYINMTPRYANTKGPIDVRVIDPLSVPLDSFTVRIIPSVTNSLDSASWELKSISTNKVWTSDQAIRIYNEQVIPEIGLAISIKQPDVLTNLAGALGSGANKIIDSTNSFNQVVIESSVKYADSSRVWCYMVPDQDIPTADNWIRSGTQAADPTDKNAQYIGDLSGVGSTPTSTIYVDPIEQFEKVCNGTWAPYKLVSSATNDPGYAFPASQTLSDLTKLGSVDIVMTSDQSKWTRCPVIESGDSTKANEGNTPKCNLRSGFSRNKDGSIDNSSTGMSWFPGYAVCLETGERLNMIFAEDSRLQKDNGRDMLFNPTGTYSQYNSATNSYDPIWGGKHFVYVIGHNDGSYPSPAYDEGVWSSTLLRDGSQTSLRQVFLNVWWVGIPMAYPGKEKYWLDNDLRFRIRIARKYSRYSDQGGTSAASPLNNNYPLYGFSTLGISTVVNDNQTAKTALDLINVVPNPYNAFSSYEVNQLDNRIKIVNLPEKCDISIYTVGGILIRKFSKDATITSLDWDLKNSSGIPIASGIYLIHVKSDGIGERVIKWFGTMRPIDLDSY